MVTWLVVFLVYLLIRDDFTNYKLIDGFFGYHKIVLVKDQPILLKFSVLKVILNSYQQKKTYLNLISHNSYRYDIIVY